MKRLLTILILLLFCKLGGLLAQDEMGLDWKASWISPSFPEEADRPTPPVFQKTFTASHAIKSATLCITAHGLYEAFLNDKRVGDAYFTPGYTSYYHRLQYQVYNVTKLLQEDANTLTVTVGDGWYRGIFGGSMHSDNYGSDASLLAQLSIRYEDGREQLIISDSSWRVSTGPVRHADLYTGESQDTRITPAHWSNVIQANYPKTNLIPGIGEPVTQQEIFRPIRIFTGPKGEQIIDFGQNIAGWVRIRVRGRTGQIIRIAHAETLDKDGNFYTGNLRNAQATDQYILNGTRQTLQPHFTYHGFRFAKIDGFLPTKHNCTAIALHTHLTHTGTFSCSNPLINQLQHNIEWSLNDNFFDIPTDCPQRSERLGWTGDAQVFCRTACFNRDVRHFFAKWLADLAAEQGSNGGLPVTVPRLDRGNTGGIAGWGDAATIIPWTLFEVYGDTAILRRQYGSMKAWVDYIARVSPHYLWKAGGYGDWYAPGASTDIGFIDQCFFAHSTALLVGAATALRKTDDSIKYSLLLQNVKQAFLTEYPGVLDTQTACVLALQFDLLPDPLRSKAAQRLVDLIDASKDHLATGFLGTPYLLNVLSSVGYTNLAFKILNQTTMPSWLYPVTQGATSIWEKWDAIRPDGGFDTCSLNHYAYGAVGDWLYSVVAGIDAAAPGYKRIIIHPRIGGGLRWVKASYRCGYGKIVSNWKIVHDRLLMRVEIPEGTTATVYVPGTDIVDVGPGGHSFHKHL